MPTLEDMRAKFRKGFKPIASTPDPFEGEDSLERSIREKIDDLLDAIEDELESDTPTGPSHANEPGPDAPSAPGMQELVKRLRARKQATRSPLTTSSSTSTAPAPVATQGATGGYSQWKWTPTGINDATLQFGIFKGQLVSKMSRDECSVTGRDGRVRKGRGYLGWLREKLKDDPSVPGLYKRICHWLDMTRGT